MKTYRSYTEIKLELHDYFSDAFKDGLIPNNAYIDKSKTGLGITYSEFHAQRDSIIVVPSLAIIENKISQYKDIKPLEVSEDTKIVHVEKYLTSNVPFKKIITTPEGFYKIIKASEETIGTNVLHESFFCFLDEVHCYSTDRYRKNIIRPFKWFWRFDHKAMGTATPFHFSDNRFKTLDFYKITYEKTFGKITIIEHDRPINALVHLLKENKFKGSVHIFFNSVKQIAKAIRLAGLSNVNVFCRDDEKNKRTLAEHSVHFRKKPTPYNIKTINFYSCKYNEGWDLYDDENTTIVLVTDIKVKHSLVGIQFKGFQAVGRLRSTQKDENGKPKHIQPHKIFHITNSFGKDDCKDFSTITKEWFFEATQNINYYNLHNYNCKSMGMTTKFLSNDLIKPIAKNERGYFILNNMKLDQLICEEYCNESYSNIETIKDAWRSVNYDVEVKLFDIEVPKDITLKKEVFRAIVKILEDFEVNKDKYLEGVAEQTISKLHSKYRNLHKCYLALGAKRIEELDYDELEMNKERARVGNLNVFEQIRCILLQHFDLRGRYTRAEIKEVIQELYTAFDYINPNGKVCTAVATDLVKVFGFEFKECGKLKVGNTMKPAVVIVSKPDTKS